LDAKRESSSIRSCAAGGGRRNRLLLLKILQPGQQRVRALIRPAEIVEQPDQGGVGIGGGAPGIGVSASAAAGRIANAGTPASAPRAAKAVRREGFSTEIVIGLLLASPCSILGVYIAP